MHHRGRVNATRTRRPVIEQLGYPGKSQVGIIAEQGRSRPMVHPLMPKNEHPGLGLGHHRQMIFADNKTELLYICGSQGRYALDHRLGLATKLETQSLRDVTQLQQGKRFLLVSG